VDRGFGFWRDRHGVSWLRTFSQTFILLNEKGGDMRGNIRVLGAFGVLSLAILSWSGSCVLAQDKGGDPDAIAKQQFKEQEESIKRNAQAARQEEDSLRDQIRQAEQSGDKQKAKSLREQLRALHEENVQQKQQDQQELKDSRKKWNADKKAARQEKKDANDDGTVDKKERDQLRKKKMDANQDGTVDKAERDRSRERRHKYDKDNNPPGPKGGAGTNWENQPGPQGGPGASPNKKFHQNN
jgi:hypothetical protein